MAWLHALCASAVDDLLPARVRIRRRVLDAVVRGTVVCRTVGLVHDDLRRIRRRALVGRQRMVVAHGVVDGDVHAEVVAQQPRLVDELRFRRAVRGDARQAFRQLPAVVQVDQRNRDVGDDAKLLVRRRRRLGERRGNGRHGEQGARRDGHLQETNELVAHGYLQESCH